MCPHTRETERRGEDRARERRRGVVLAASAAALVGALFVFVLGPLVPAPVAKGGIPAGCAGAPLSPNLPA